MTHKYSKHEHEGRTAYLEGKPQDANPYKGERRSGNAVYAATPPYSFWAMGWNDESNKDKEEDGS